MTLIMAQMPGFEPGPVHVGFMADKVSLERSFGHIRIITKNTYLPRHVRPCQQVSVPHCCRRHKFAPSAFVCVQHSTYIHCLTVTCSSIIHIKHTVAFPLGQLLRESSTMLRSTYMTCHALPNASIFPRQYHSTHIFVLLFTLTLLRPCFRIERERKLGT
jgi:hypothetical protein